MPTHSKDPILIAGCGRVAQAMGRLLAERGEPVYAVAGRDPARAAAAAAFIGYGVLPTAFTSVPERTTRVIVAVSDSAIAEVAARLAKNGLKHGIALHTCGAMGSEALAALASAGVACGTVHPLQTVSSPEHGLSALTGCAYVIDGDPPALAWAKRIASAFGGKTLLIPSESRPYYHAAAVMASNYVVALVDAAAMLMKAAGVGEEAALRALWPIIETSANNAVRLGPVRALTGPIQRGDVQTLRGHVKALREMPESLRTLYRSAGLHALDIAVRRGLEPEVARLVEKTLREGEIENAGSEQAGAGT